MTHGFTHCMIFLGQAERWEWGSVRVEGVKGWETWGASDIHTDHTLQGHLLMSASQSLMPRNHQEKATRKVAVEGGLQWHLVHIAWWLIFCLWTWRFGLHVNRIPLSKGMFPSWNLVWTHQVELPHIHTQVRSHDISPPAASPELWNCTMSLRKQRV